MSARRFSNYLVIFKSAIVQPFLDFIFPPRCFGCDKDIDSGLVCNKCFTQITTTALGTCSICGIPKIREGTCKHHLGWIQSKISRIRALGLYGKPYIELIHNLKYLNKKKIAQVLGLGLTNVINSDPILSRADFIVPIPLHSSRLRERGYNQSLLLAQEAASGSGITINDCLIRKKNTRSQTELDQIKRIKNINGAFTIKPKLNYSIKDKRVILIDDVMTSGTTLAEAAKVLIENGASEVYGAVVTTARI